MSFSRLSCLLAITFFANTILSAGTIAIDFATVPGNDGDLFSTFSGKGFEVIPIGGTWSVSKSVGNPAPAIYTQSFGVIQVASGPFFFNSVDVENAGGLVTIIGYYNGFQDFRGSFVGPNMFQTVDSPTGRQIFDYLLIGINTANGGTGYVDNIVLTPVLPFTEVPEPTSVILVSTALLAVALRARMAR